MHILDHRILGLVKRVNPYWYTYLYRRIHGQEKQIHRLVQTNAATIIEKSRGSKKCLFVDCGVNEGVVLAHYRKALSGFDFIGFEIQKDVIKQAKKMNPTVELRNVAVSAQDGEAEVFLVEKSRVNIRGGTSTLRPRGTMKPIPSYTVPTIRFVDFLTEKRNHGYDFIAVKMDIEGAEYPIIEDLHKSFLSTDKALMEYFLIEFHPTSLEAGDENERYSRMLKEMSVDYPKFISKIDKCLISFRPNGQKCYNKSAVRLALAG